MRKLAAFGPDQAAVVEQSIANGWQGLFPVERRAQPDGGTARVMTDEARAQSDRAAIELSARAHGLNPAGLSEAEINNLIFSKRSAN